MLISRQVISVGLETTYGQAATIDPAADSVLVNTITVSNANARMVERPVIKPTLDPVQSVFAGTLGSVQIQCEVKGSGTNTTAPEIGPLLQACGMAEKVNADSVVYNSSSADAKSVTIEAYQDGRLYKLVGCRGTFNVTANAGEVMLIDFTLTGHYDSHSDTELPSPTYDSTVPVPLIDLSGLLIGATVVPKIGALTFDVANEIVTPADITDKMGFGEVRIGKRAITGTIDPEMELIATVDYLKDWMDGKAQSFTTGPIGTAAGNIVQVDFAEIAYTEVSQAERDQILTESLTFGAYEKTADDALTITFK